MIQLLQIGDKVNDEDNDEDDDEDDKQVQKNEYHEPLVFQWIIIIYLFIGSVMGENKTSRLCIL